MKTPSRPIVCNLRSSVEDYTESAEAQLPSTTGCCTGGQRGYYHRNCGEHRSEVRLFGSTRAVSLIACSQSLDTGPLRDYPFLCGPDFSRVPATYIVLSMVRLSMREKRISFPQGPFTTLEGGNDTEDPNDEGSGRGGLHQARYGMS